MTAYFLQVCAGIAAWWLLYRLFFRGKAAAKTNRFFLLGGLILPFALPLIPMSSEMVTAVEPILLPAVTINATDFMPAQTGTQFQWVLWVYLAGFVGLLCYQMGGLVSFFKLKKSAQKEEHSNIYRLAKHGMPFSYFGTIFLPEQLPAEQEKLIVTHENWHIKLGHSFDVAWAALVQSALWFFPLIPIYVRDIRTEHEYEVDEKMLSSTTFSTYAETLLHVSLLPIGHTQFHSFSSPTLKNRIKMMTKTQKQNTWKLILFIPLIGSMVYLNACNKTDSATPEKPASLKMDDVDVPPQFTECQTNEGKKEQIKCFNSGIVQQIMNNMEFPESAKKAGVEGTILVGFVIDEEGNIGSKTIKRSIETNAQNEVAVMEMENAALDVFENFPVVTPAQKDGKAVAVEYIVPIRFALPE